MFSKIKSAVAVIYEQSKTVKTRSGTTIRVRTDSAITQLGRVGCDNLSIANIHDLCAQTGFETYAQKCVLFCFIIFPENFLTSHNVNEPAIKYDQALYTLYVVT